MARDNTLPSRSGDDDVPNDDNISQENNNDNDNDNDSNNTNNNTYIDPTNRKYTQPQTNWVFYLDNMTEILPMYKYNKLPNKTPDDRFLKAWSRVNKHFMKTSTDTPCRKFWITHRYSPLAVDFLYSGRVEIGKHIKIPVPNNNVFPQHASPFKSPPKPTKYISCKEAHAKSIERSINQALDDDLDFSQISESIEEQQKQLFNEARTKRLHLNIKPRTLFEEDDEDGKPSATSPLHPITEAIVFGPKVHPNQVPPFASLPPNTNTGASSDVEFELDVTAVAEKQRMETGLLSSEKITHVYDVLVSEKGGRRYTTQEICFDMNDINQLVSSELSFPIYYTTT